MGMFGNGDEKEPCYAVELFSRGSSIKKLMIRGEYTLEDREFQATNTSGKEVTISLGEYDTLIIEEI